MANISEIPVDPSVQRLELVHAPQPGARLRALAGSILLGHSPEEREGYGENFFDILSTVPRHLDEIENCPPYAAVGGGPTAVLMAEGTIIDKDNRRVIAPPDLYKPQFRGNGTRVDFDVLVFNPDPLAADVFRRALVPNPLYVEHGTPEQREAELAKPGAKIDIGVTPLMPVSNYDLTDASPTRRLMSYLTEGFVSTRTEDQNGKRAWSVADINMDLAPEYFETWELELPSGQTIPMLHPLAHMIGYTIRTGHGVRAGDVPKLKAMDHLVGPHFGTRLAWSHKNRRASLIADNIEGQPYESAAKFANTANQLLQYEAARERLGTARAAALMVKFAGHGWFDEHAKFLGQGGEFFRHIITPVSGERQQRL